MLILADAVLLDGSTPAPGVDPLAPFTQRIRVPRATDTTIRVTFKKQDATLLDLTLGTVVLGVRYGATDVDPIFVRPGVIVGPPVDGIAEFPIVQADTLNFFPSGFFWDVHYTDPGGTRTQVIPYSPFMLAASAALPTDPLTSPDPSAIVIGPIPDRTGNDGKVLGLVAGLLTWVIAGGGAGIAGFTQAARPAPGAGGESPAVPRVIFNITSSQIQVSDGMTWRDNDGVLVP